jgi:hypothetical protein
MRATTSVIVFGILTGLCCGPVAAHSPYFSQSEAMSSARYQAVTLKLLNGDGILFADPIRAIVVDQHGTLLATSPLSPTLRIYCEESGPQRQCLVYDDLARTIYQPVEDEWRDDGPLEKDGKPQRYPEGKMSEFGFDERGATIGEIARFELAGMFASWKTTGVAIAWWALFWLLLRPVARYILGPDRRLTIGRITALLVRTAGALLMIPVATHAWLIAPYSMIYLAVVVTGGAMIALMLARWRTTPAS